MIRFNNDYNHGAHPEILEALSAVNDNSFGGYGEDEWCKKAADLIRERVHCPDAAIHFFPGATQANFIVIASALSSEENEPEYYTEPKMVYLSFPTEQGTLYSLEELKAIRKVCDKYGMYLFVDGARLGYGLGAVENDISVEDFAALTDVFYFGGTKCGTLFGEAVVITSNDLKRRFKAFMKQNGAVLAKGWLLGLQFYTLLENDLYFEITKKADVLAMKIRDAFAKKGIPFWVESPTNQQFVILNEKQQEVLGQNYTFEKTGSTPDGVIARFCTSWATTEEEVAQLIGDIEKL